MYLSSSQKKHTYIPHVYEGTQPHDGEKTCFQNEHIYRR